MKRRIHKTIWGNWNGYEGAIKTREFGCDVRGQMDAEEWLAEGKALEAIALIEEVCGWAEGEPTTSGVARLVREVGVPKDSDRVFWSGELLDEIQKKSGYNEAVVEYVQHASDYIRAVGQGRIPKQHPIPLSSLPRQAR